MKMFESPVKVASAPLKRTAVAPARLLPLMLTRVPGPPLAGEKLAMTGTAIGTVTEKTPVLVAVPAGVTTVIGPAPALAGACAVIRVLDCTVNEGADTPLNRTWPVPTKLLPSIVTVVPAGPLP